MSSFCGQCGRALSVSQRHCGQCGAMVPASSGHLIESVPLLEPDDLHTTVRRAQVWAESADTGGPAAYGVEQPIPEVAAGGPAVSHQRLAPWMLPVAITALIAVALLGWFAWRATTPSGVAPSAGKAAQVTVTATVTAAPVAESAAAPMPLTPPPAAVQPSTVAVPMIPSYPGVQIPAGGQVCGNLGAGPYAYTATGNESTSCPFAVNVQTAYIAAGGNGRPVVINAYSPVTNKAYAMSCSGDQPAVCTGGVAAIILLFGGQPTL